MSQCELCELEMSTASGCTVGLVTVNGEDIERVRFGHEGQSVSVEGTRCHDCNAEPDHYHHLDCDVEICPICHGQWLGHGRDCEPEANSDGQAVP